MIKNLLIKLLIFCVQNLYEVCSRFFHKIFDSAKEKRFDCSSWKFWDAEISADPQNGPLEKKVKKLEKSKNKLKKSKKWIFSKKKA